MLFRVVMDIFNFFNFLIEVCAVCFIHRSPPPTNRSFPVAYSVMLMSDYILGDNDDPSTQFEGMQDLVPSPPHSNSIHDNSSFDLEITDGSNLFGAWASDGAVSNDITMDD
jgi:hypothetical protein